MPKMSLRWRVHDALFAYTTLPFDPGYEFDRLAEQFSNYEIALRTSDDVYRYFTKRPSKDRKHK